jgi:hypothetical protein
LQSLLLWFRRQRCRFHHRPRSTRSSSRWWRRPPTRGTKWSSSQTLSWFSSSTASLPTPCIAASVSVAPKIASSQDSSIVRSCPRFLSDSSTAVGNANATSQASTVNTPPFLLALPHLGCHDLRLLLRPHPL